MAEGTILNIQRMSTEDGPGLRTTVFFKGCTLACKWCHNPESISFKKEHEWFNLKCIMCRTCEAACPNSAISFFDEGLRIDYTKCKRCMKCTILCPANALEAKGIEYSAQDLFCELMKDKAYFGEQGGVTLSGGEALAQHEFALQLLSMLYDAGVNTAVDTCGQVKFDFIREAYKYSPLFLYDLKLMDSDRHKEYTGTNNEHILQNFADLADMIRAKRGAKLWIRTPLIPEATDSTENIAAIAKFIENTASDVFERWELLEFNNLCASKYQRLNKTWDFKNAKKQDRQKIDEIKKTISEFKKIRQRTYVAGENVL